MEFEIFNNIFFIIFGVLIAAGLFFRPVVGFFLLVLIIPLESVFVLPGGITWVRIVLIFVLSAWIARKIILDESWHAMLSSNILWKTLLFLGFVFVSFVWAHMPGKVVDSIPTLLGVLALCLFMIDVGSSLDRVEMAVKFLILGGVVASTLTIVQYFVLDFYRAGSHITGGINKTSVMLVVLQPMAFFLFRSSRSSKFWRFIGLIYVVISPLAVAFTFSRIAYAIMPFVYIRQLFTNKIERMREVVVIAILGLLIATSTIIWVPWEKVELRLNSLSPLVENPDEVVGGRVFVSSRIHIWRCAFEIFKDNSILGVGNKHFGYHFTHYQFIVPGMKNVKKKYNRSPHSTILGIMAELGVAGLLLWIFLQYTVYKNFHISLQSCESQNGKSNELLTRAIQQVFIIFTVYSLVSNIHLAKLFWLVLGMNGALFRLSKLPANEDE